MLSEPAAPRLVSVIVPARDVASVIPHQLAALSKQDYEGRWEVLVVDNGSTDGTAEVAARWTDRLPSMRVLRHEPRGVNGARNAGARAARGDLLVYCDADDVATTGWLTAMARASASADVIGGYLEVEALNTERIRTFRPANPPDRLPVHVNSMPYAVGSNMGVRTEVYQTLNGFDESYTGGGGDDVEFSLRAQLMGYSVEFVPDAVMCYRLRKRLRSLAWQQMCYGRADARLLRDFRRHGLSFDRRGNAAAQWLLLLLLAAPAFVVPERTGRWVCEAAWRLGRLIGSAEHRVWCP